MYEKTSAKTENNKKTSRKDNATNKHSLNKSKNSSSCGSCGACRSLSSPRLSSENASSVLSHAKAMGKESCAVSFMQRNYGNRFTASVLSPTIQKKCSCGGSCSNCKGEEEADKVATNIMKMQSPAISKKEAIGYKAPANNDEQTHISEIMSNKGSGHGLDDNTSSFMEQGFGYDFSHVRLHTDSYAARKSNELNAEAFTIGRDVFFNAGRYNPSSTEGKQLLAHELTHVVQQGADATASPQGVLQRYSHEDCTDADLRTHIWPADGIAKRKVNAAIAAVTASPVSPTTEALFAKYFMTRAPDVTVIKKVFRKLKTAFDDDRYTYECEEDCKSETNAYSGFAWDIHLCMNNLRGRANDCIARTIIHEFTHKYAGTGHGWWFSTAHCYSGCNTAGCPSDLSPSDALGNAYSFAGFAHEA